MTLVPVVTAALAAAPSGTPERVSHVYQQHLVAPPERVLPLLTPLGERAWAEGWDPQMRWEPPGGGAGTLFVVRHPGEPDTVWVLDNFDPGEGHVHYIHVTPGSDVTEIDIRLRPEGSGATVATVRYTWTSLGPPGVALVRSKTAAAYLASMRHWEHALNHHLAGSAVRSEPATAPGH
jgi:Polyketide cyclase / dehydrase and lipid transport